MRKNNSSAWEACNYSLQNKGENTTTVYRRCWNIQSLFCACTYLWFTHICVQLCLAFCSTKFISDWDWHSLLSCTLQNWWHWTLDLELMVIDAGEKSPFLISRCGRSSPVCAVPCFAVSLAVWQVPGSFPFHAVSTSSLCAACQGQQYFSTFSSGLYGKV